jgi:GDP-4-dehydro-6-deoxy-D-mannose reductase
MDPEVPTPETAPLRPVSHYGESKVLAEELAWTFARMSEVDVCVARLFNVIGPGEPKGSVMRAIIDQLLEAPEGGLARVQLLEERSCRDFVDVRDVASALVTLAERGVAGEAYNVCTGETVCIRELFDVAVATSGRSATLEVTKPDLQPSVSQGACAKLRALGWEPQRALAESIADEMGELG